MYKDLGWLVRSDPVFGARIEKLANEIRVLEDRGCSKYGDNEKVGELIGEIYRACDFNAGLLVPYFFPEYPRKKPLSLFSRPFSVALFHMQIGGFMAIRGSRQIGKSTSIAARQLIHSHILPKYRSLYVVPHIEHLKTYANRVREMERAFRFSKINDKFRQNLTFKEYPNGAIIEMVRVLTSAGETHGKTTDEIIFDEVQYFDPELEPEVVMTQKASEIPTTIFAGTSVTVDTPLEAKYQQSSQGCWHLRAGDGVHWINTADPEDVLRIIQPDGPTCPYTGKILNVEEGQYVHAYPDMIRCNQIGFSIPQLIIPDYTNNPIKWMEIYQAFKQWDLKKFLQEVMGIPTEEGSREISMEALKTMCCLPDSPEYLKQRALKGYYRHIISGCDWGGSDYNPADRTKVSYTVHAILGLTFDKKFDILHFRRYSGMDYRDIANHIIADHTSYNADALASDFGVGSTYNMLLRESNKINVNRHLIFNYVGPNTAPVSVPHNACMFNQYSLNRTEAITQLYGAIREEPPRIRCFHWDKAREFLLDFMNLYRIPTESNGGAGTFRYRRHGAKADDSLHAVNFAYTMGRLLIGEPLLEDVALKRTLDMVLRAGSATPTAGLGGFNVASGLVSG